MSADQWQDLELEREVLADAIFGVRADEYLLRLTRAEFSHEQFGRIFEAVSGVRADDRIPDYATVRAWLADRGWLDTLTNAAIGDVLKGRMFLDVGRSCERLLTLSRRRRVRDELRCAIARLDEDPASIESGFTDQIGERLTAASAPDGLTVARRPLVVASDAIDQWVQQPPISDRVLPLGVVPAFDQQMRGGLEPGECLFTLARPGSLKTMLALNVLRGWLARSPGAFFVLVELEMPKRQLIERLARMHFGMNSERLDYSRRGRCLDIEGFKAALSGLFVVDDVGLTLADIERRVRLVARQNPGKTLGGIVVDHCGLVRAEQGTSAYDRATETAIGIKQLARRLETVVYAVVQANRTAAQTSRAGDPPEMEQARDSGAYEENADFMLSMSAIQPGGLEYVKVRLVKNRRGAAWTTNVGFNPQTLRMTELQTEGDTRYVA